jgi:hypothetical protein
MSKGTKLALFVLAATVFNVAATALAFLALLGLYALTLSKILPQSAVMWAVVVSFTLSIAFSILLYRKLLRVARAKFDLDRKLGLVPDKSKF